MIDNSILDVVEYIGEKINTPLVLISHENENDWNYFQYLLKVAAYVNQDGLCICQKPLNNRIELHHALVTKQDVRGYSNKEIIHHPYNVIASHSSCHHKITRQQSFEYLSDIYGSDKVLNFYNKINSLLKTKLRGIEHVNARNKGN